MIEVNNRILNKPILEILQEVQRNITNGKLSVIRQSGQNDLQVTCPFHADGHEHRPSCFIRKEDGVYHCFTCGEAGGLSKFVAACMDVSESEAARWLVANYGGDYTKRELPIDYVNLNEVEEDEKETILPESTLEGLESYHPYFTQRKLSDEIIKKFELKYEPKTECVVFPVRDSDGNLIGLTKRKVKYKRYELPKFKKPVYLLYKIKEEHINSAIITESQINALTCWSWGYPAIATFGCNITDEQIESIKKSDLRYITLGLDPDEAGIKGTIKLCRSLPKYMFVDVVLYNDKTRDINDLSKEEFDALPRVDRYEYLNKIIK